MSRIKLCLVIFGVILSYCDAFKILVVFPLLGKSHSILGDGYVRHLLMDGHEVTYITPFDFKYASSKLRVINTSENLIRMPEDVLKIENLMTNNIIMEYNFLLPMFYGMAKMTLENKNVQTLINDPNEHFDVVIAEWMFTELFSSLAAVFNCPLIWSSSVDAHWLILKLIDQSSNPAYTGDTMTSNLPPFTFTQRVSELYTQLKVQYMKYMIFDNLEKQTYETLVAPAIKKCGREPPSYYELQYNASLVLSNSHTSLGQAIPVPQSFISIGGYHIEDDLKPLPEDMAVLVFVLFCLTVLSQSCNAYRALVVYPMPARSHGILGNGVVQQLLKDGNEVVYLRAHDYKNDHPKLRHIDVSENKVVMPAHTLNLTVLLEKEHAPNDYALIMRLMISLLAKTLEVKEVHALLNDPKEQFDVVIVEWMFCDILSGLATIFNAPLIWMSPIEVNPAVLGLIDEMPNPAYNANGFSSNVVPFTFKERLEELWTQLKVAYLNQMYFDKMQEDEYNRLLAPYILKRGRQTPPFNEVRYNASLILGNSHIAIGGNKRLPQNYKHIGGFHIDETVKPLPEDLKKIIEESKDGFIYFSMGSNLKSKDWPVVIKQDLLKMFGELKQTVLWKFEENLPGVPKNVHILKWAPQPSILAHPNCLLFISHGGLLSQTETIHYGVPIIGIPVFGDQFINVKRAVRKGFALQVDLTYDLAKNLRVAIKEMLSKTTYRDRIKELSYVYHNRPLKPAQELSHWVQHVIKTRGATHLRSPAFHVPLYQRLCLDLFSLIVVALASVLVSLKFVYSLLCS